MANKINFNKLDVKKPEYVTLDSNDSNTRHIIKGIVNEDVYTKETVDEKINNLNKNIDQKFETFEERTDKKFSEFYNKISEAKASKREYFITIAVAIFGSLIASPLLSYILKLIFK